MGSLVISSKIRPFDLQEGQFPNCMCSQCCCPAQLQVATAQNLL